MRALAPVDAREDNFERTPCYNDFVSAMECGEGN